MKPFQYLQPESVEEAIAMLRRHGREAKLIAGGTDLLIQMGKKGLHYPYLIGLKQIKGLAFIKDEPERRMVRIGAMTLIQDIADSPMIKQKFPFLADACRQLGSIQVRNVATVGGNLCNSAPSAEAAPPLLSLDAQAIVWGPTGKRKFPLEEFFRGPGQNSLEGEEVLKEVEIPHMADGVRGSYQKLAHRRAVDIAVVNVAVLVKTRPDEICEMLRLTLGAVAPVPLRVRKAENLVAGQKWTEALIQRVSQLAAAEASPITDVRGTAEYRREMVRVLVARGIKQIWKAGKESLASSRSGEE